MINLSSSPVAPLPQRGGDLFSLSGSVLVLSLVKISYILFLQPLSEKLESCGVGGAELPGGLVLRDLVYADDIGLLSETVDGMNKMLRMCQEWADQEGMQFSVDKSKAMILAGPEPSESVEVMLGDSSLEWVNSFCYLGCSIWARNKYYKYEPASIKSLNQAVMPVISAIHHDGLPNLPLVQRAQALVVLAEGRALHNAQVIDLDTKRVNTYINRGLRAVTGLTDSTLLRCDLGIIPAELVVQRNCMYYLWHIRRRAWFSEYIPAMQHLYPVRRIADMTLQYEDIPLDKLDTDTYEQWRSRVKKAVAKRATTFYDVSEHHSAALYPQRQYKFQSGGQSYVTNPGTLDLAQTALELRQDHLPVSRDLMPWEHHPCSFCGLEGGLSGRHILQCCQIPDELSVDRADLISEFYPGLSPERFAMGVIACYGAHVRPSKKKAHQTNNRHYSTECLRRSLTLGQKIMWAARTALKSLLIEDADNTADSPASFDRALYELFQEEFLPMEVQAEDPQMPSGPRLIGDVTAGGLSAMALAAA